MKTVTYGAGVFAICDFLSADECQTHIAAGESIGFGEAAIRTETGERVYRDARNNDRVIVDDPVLASDMFERAKPLLQPDAEGWLPCGFNPRWRYYRYHVGQQFVWHYDGSVRIAPDQESILTFMVYLNDDFEGGSTDFGWDSVQPRRGMALVFPHRLRHQGAPVRAGVKYVVRTDVMFRQARDQ